VKRPDPDPCYLLEQYEALRREALERVWSGERGHGLALFLARGMSAWLSALRALVPPPVSRGQLPGAEESLREYAPMRQPSVRAELATLLAGMLLAVSEGEAVE
jgi:hypothetical protein